MSPSQKKAAARPEWSKLLQMSSPSDPQTLLDLARLDLANGQLAAAQERCLQVLGAHQHHPGALQVLGEILCSQGRHEEAVRVFNALTLMQPTVATHWQNLGTALRPMRRHAQALAAFERALQLGPPSAGLLYNLGVLQMDRCEYHAAHLALRDAVALAPTHATIRWAFAQCCYDMTRLEEAVAALESWQQLEQLTPEISVLIVLLLVMMGAVHEAEPALQRLLAHPPQAGRSALVVACIQERLHRLGEARETLRHLERDATLATDPERLLMSAVLAERAGQYTEAHSQLSLALEHQREFVHQHKLLYPLARMCDALGRYDEAYAAAERAHVSQLALLELQTGKVSVEESQPWSHTAHGCDPDDVAMWERAGPAMHDTPIFIVGFPRSGTTLLEQVLDAHPQLQSMDEQPFLLTALAEVSDRGTRYPGGLGQLSRQDLEEIRAHYWDRARKRGRLAPGRRLVDKNPLSMLVLPLIRRLFPEARIVLAIRHPCDTLLSCFLQHFRAPGLALACRDLATLAQAYSRAFDFWYSQAALLHPVSYELRYEDLTADIATEVGKLTAFLQLPWDEAMLTPWKRARAKGFINTPSYAQVIEPVSTRAVGRWHRYERHFTPAVRVALRPWIERWGYSFT
jgi:tetratricopeptide (TPR) repeat protein